MTSITTSAIDTPARRSVERTCDDLAMLVLAAVAVIAGLTFRYEWFSLRGSFGFDATQPTISYQDPRGETHTEEMPRQWQVDMGIGLTY